MKQRLPLTVATLVLAGISAGGCQRALFPHDEPRTQYDLADRMRNTDVPLVEPDAFGKPRPNLRGRLVRQ